MNVFFISDHHFGHGNIIKYENRPFFDVDSMTEHMIKAWNKVVGKNDKVYVLGDFSFYGFEKTESIVKRLNGFKYLVVGNHDRRKSNEWWRRVGFKEVYDKPIIYNDFFILSHEPVYVNQCMPYLNIHGHLHSKKMVSAEDNQYINVSVECWDYEPQPISSFIMAEGEEG